MKAFVLGLWCRLVGHAWQVEGLDFCSIWHRGKVIDCPLPGHDETCQQDLPIERCSRCGAVRRNVSAALEAAP